VWFDTQTAQPAFLGALRESRLPTLVEDFPLCGEASRDVVGSDVAYVSPGGYGRVVIRLRLVDEYRGRRIVTNGTLYGIQGELITDCRYLNVAGARAAIDSEIAIDRRKRDLDEQRAQFENYVEREGRERRSVATAVGAGAMAS
jgi:hypothetical protein